MRDTPSYHPFDVRIFHEINHPFGVPPLKKKKQLAMLQGTPSSADPEAGGVSEKSWWLPQNGRVYPLVMTNSLLLKMTI